MPLIIEVIEGLDRVAKTIENISKIREAILEGKDYIAVKHPEIKKDLGLLLGEFRKTMHSMANASAVLTNFRFAIASDAGTTELRKFNDYYIHHKEQARFLEEHLDDLRGHCSIVRDHAFRIGDKTATSGIMDLFSLMGFKSPKREQELAKMLDQLAYEEFEDANALQIMVSCLKDALNEVQYSLQKDGVMYPENIPEAAKLLSEYATKFEELENSAIQAEKEIKKVINELEK